MDIIICGMRHQAIALREQVNFTDTKKMELQQQLREIGIKNILVLSTCNRSEILCIADPRQLQKVPMLYQNFFALDKQEFIDIYEKEQAIAHFYRICAGLDSVLVGEDQIFHQVKSAYRFACDSGCANKPLHTFLQKAFHFTKQLKEELKVSEHPLTSSYVAMKKLKQKTSLSDKVVLLSGSGELIQECIPYLLQEKPALIYMLVRSIEKRKTIHSKYPTIQMHSFEERYSLWQKADVIISATTSPHILYTKEQINSDQKERWIFDLALPRDVDERLRENRNLHIYDIDELQHALQKHTHLKKRAVEEAQERIHKESTLQYKQLQTTAKDSLIADFQQHLLAMSNDTYHLLEQKLSLQPHEQRVVKKTLDYAFLRFLQDWLALVEHSDEEKEKLLIELIEQYKGGN